MYFIQKSFFKKDFKEKLQLVNFIPVRLLCLWGSPGQNTGVGCGALLQGIFQTKGSNLRLLCLLHWQAVLFCFVLLLALLGKP